MKLAGFDGIVIQGRSEKPVYLWIKDGKAEIRDASHLTGKDTGEAQRLIREELGDERIRGGPVRACGREACAICLRSQ